MNSLGHRFLQAAGWQFAGNLLRVLLGLAASVLIVRWLGAEEFGKASWILSLTMHASILGSLGLGTPLTRRLTLARLDGCAATTRRLLKQVLVLRLLVVAVAVLVFGVLRLWAPEELGRMAAPRLLLFVPLMLLASFLQGAVVRVLQVHFRQGLVAVLTAMEIVIKVAVIRLLGGGSPGAADLLTASVAAELVSFLWAGLVIRSLLGGMTGSADHRADQAVGIRTLLREGKPSWALAISERVLGREVDVFLLGVLVGPVEVARYALPFTLASISVSVATSVFQSTTNLTAFTEAGSAGGDRGRQALLKALFEFWALFVLPIAVGGMLVGGRLLNLLYGEAAQGLGVLSALLFASFAFSSISGLAKDALQGAGDDLRPAQVHGLGGAVNLALSLLLIPVFGAEGAAAATLVATLLIALVQVRGLPASLRVSPGGRPLRAALAALVVLAIGVRLGALPVFGPASAWFSTLVSVAVGGAGYLAGLAVFGPHSSLRQRLDHAPGPLRAARWIL